MPEKARHASPCFPSASPSAWVARPLLTLLRSTNVPSPRMHILMHGQDLVQQDQNPSDSRSTCSK